MFSSECYLNEISLLVLTIKKYNSYTLEAINCILYEPAVLIHENTV